MASSNLPCPISRRGSAKSELEFGEVTLSDWSLGCDEAICPGMAPTSTKQSSQKQAALLPGTLIRGLSTGIDFAAYSVRHLRTSRSCFFDWAGTFPMT